MQKCFIQKKPGIHPGVSAIRDICEMVDSVIAEFIHKVGYGLINSFYCIV